MNLRSTFSRFLPCAIAAGAIFAAAAPASAQFGRQAPPAHYDWSDQSLSPDQRADMVLKEMTIDEKISLLHGQGFSFGQQRPRSRTESNGGAGLTPAIPRLGIPAIQMADSAYGVTRGAFMGRYSTALPSDLGAASSWDPQAAFEYGQLIGTRAARPGLLHVPGRRREPAPRAAQRPHL